MTLGGRRVEVLGRRFIVVAASEEPGWRAGAVYLYIRPEEKKMAQTHEGEHDGKEEPDVLVEG